LAKRRQKKLHVKQGWWTPLRPWPRGVRFEDGEVEREVGRYLPPPPAPIGAYGCAAGLCATSRFAESEFDERVGGVNAALD
jgi:hypothetical protein